MNAADLPDRISAEPDSPHYPGSDVAMRLRVFVDGVPITHCVEADRAAGWADMVVTIGDEQQLARERHHGTVTFSLR